MSVLVVVSVSVRVSGECGDQVYVSVSVRTMLVSVSVGVRVNKCACTVGCNYNCE